jgi:predicted RNA-binding protein YlxR (DUF448 family)
VVQPGAGLPLRRHRVPDGRLTGGMTARTELLHLPEDFPMRTCIGCRERAAKSSLLRLVATGDGVIPDPQARLPGRGAYLHPGLHCLGLAQRRRAFPRALRVAGPLEVDVLVSYLSHAVTLA